MTMRLEYVCLQVAELSKAEIKGSEGGPRQEQRLGNVARLDHALAPVAVRPNSSLLQVSSLDKYVRRSALT